MTAVFERILDMSLTAAVVIGLVVVIRLLLAKAPKKWSYTLWSVAAFRLVCPVSFRSVFSLFTLTEQVGQALPTTPAPAPLPTGGTAVSPVTTAPPVTTFPGTTTPIPSGPVVTVPAVSAPVVTAPVTQAPAAPAFDWAAHAMDIAAVLWLIGVAALVVYGVVSYLRLCRRMSTATRLEGRVWQSERVQSPFILGFVKPKIYIPYRLGAEEQRYVLAHENYHLRRLDHITRPLSFFILAVHWFNPLVWVAYWLAGRDMEMSCDEKVLSKGESAKGYSTTLLSFAANRRLPVPGPLAFGESGVKGRVKNALHWRRPRVWVTAIALILCIVVIAACAADPEEPPEEPKTYVTVERLYWNMTSSYYDSTPNDDGLTYRIGPGSVAVTKGGTALYGSDRPDWLPLTAEVWDELDLMPHASQVWAHQSIEACEAPRYLDLGDRRYLVDLDGEYWSCRAGVSVHRLAEEGAVVERTYHSVECLYLTLVSSQLPEADSGLEYVIGPHRAAVLNHVGDVVAETRTILWQPITKEWWEEDPLLSSFRDQLWEAVEACDDPRYLPVDERHYLLDLDGTYWAGERGEHPDGTAHWWDIYRLEEGNRHPGGAPNAGAAIPMPSPVPSPDPELISEVLFTLEADLHHSDGDMEYLTVEQKEPNQYGEVTEYRLRVYDDSGRRSILWESPAIGKWGDQLIYALLEMDGKTYLGEFGCTAANGVGSWHYKVFSLMPEWEEVLYEEELHYEAASAETILAVDVESIRDFEGRCNARMGGATVLAIGGGGILSVPDPLGAFTFHCYTGEPERLEALQEHYRNEAAGSSAAATAEVLDWVDRLADSENLQFYRWLCSGSGPTGISLRGYGEELRAIFARHTWRYHDGSYDGSIPWSQADLAENGLGMQGIRVTFQVDHITVEQAGSGTPPVSYTTDDIPGLVAELSGLSGAPYLYLCLAEVPGDSITQKQELAAAYAEAFRRSYLASGKALDVYILGTEQSEPYDSGYYTLRFRFSVLPADPSEPCWDGILTDSNWYQFTYDIMVRLEEDGVWRYD